MYLQKVKVPENGVDDGCIIRAVKSMTFFHNIRRKTDWRLLAATTARWRRLDECLFLSLFFRSTRFHCDAFISQSMLWLKC